MGQIMQPVTKILGRGVLRSHPMPHYPGYKSGNHIVGNLSSYRIRDGKKTALAFDIERYVSWDKNLNLLPFAYSMMIDTYYRPALGGVPVLAHLLNATGRLRVGPNKSSFKDAVDPLEGYWLVKDKNDFVEFDNPRKNLFFDWVEHGAYSDFRRTIGVVQRREVETLSEVTDLIVPTAVSDFNYLMDALSPDRKLEDSVVAESIKMALEYDKHIPPCRIEKIESAINNPAKLS